MDEQTHATTLRLSKDIVIRLKAQSAIERRSMTSLINELCNDGLQNRGPGNQDRIDKFVRLINP